MKIRGVKNEHHHHHEDNQRQHGRMPVPVPATANIVSEHCLKMKLTDNEGEMVTPTGAADAWYTSIYMKKNRPAYMLQVLCEDNQIEEMQDIIFEHTTIVGIRRTQVERTILKREIKQVKTPYGNLSVKVCNHKENIYFYPEYEDVKRVCLEYNKNFKDVYQEIVCSCKA